MVKSFLNPVFSLQGTLFHVPKAAGAHYVPEFPRLANAVSLRPERVSIDQQCLLCNPSLMIQVSTMAI